MKTNMELEAVAVTEVAEEYKQALAKDATLGKLLEIKGRLDVLKEQFNSSQYQDLTKDISINPMTRIISKKAYGPKIKNRRSTQLSIHLGQIIDVDFVTKTVKGVR